MIAATAFSAALAPGAAFAQDEPRIFPGFEKVYKASKKREAEALRAIAAAEAEIAASAQQRLDGERQIADADAAIKSQQLSYLTLTQTFGAAQSARDARIEAAQLEAAARAWADAEAMREKGIKTVLAADSGSARASERLASAQSKKAEAQIAIARTLQDAPAPPIGQPASLTPVETQTLPPPVNEVAAPPIPASAEPKSPLDALLLGGPEGERP
ncbi:MAG TPA: hypothetical protein DDZ68_07295 [Parvularcula sp.]|nr:hypothetical protein [Parvularcula sp.]